MNTHAPTQNTHRRPVPKSSKRKKPCKASAIPSFWQRWGISGCIITLIVCLFITLTYLGRCTKLYVPIWPFHTLTGLCILGIVIGLWFKNQLDWARFIVYSLIGFFGSLLLFLILSTVYLGINYISNGTPTYQQQGIIVRKQAKNFRYKSYYLYVYDTDTRQFEVYQTTYSVYEDCMPGDTLRVTLRQGLLGHPVITEQQVMGSSPSGPFELPYHMDLKPRHIRTDP